MSIYVEHINPSSMEWEIKTFYRFDSPCYLNLLGNYFAILTQVYDEGMARREGERWSVKMMESVADKNGRPKQNIIYKQQIDQGESRVGMIVGRRITRSDLSEGQNFIYVTVDGRTY